MRYTRPARIGIVGMGHFVYWPQFPGLKEELIGKQERFKKYFSSEVQLLDLGYADDFDSSVEALQRAQKQDLDALFIMMSTYITSQVLFPFAKYLHIPQILVAIQPLDHLDYSKTTTYMQLCNDDDCSLPEFSGVYERLGAKKPFYLVAAESQEERIRQKVAELEHAISALAAFKYAKFGYLGHTYDGMYDMNTDPTAFADAFGAHVKMLEMCELAQYVEEADEEAICSKVEEIKGIFTLAEPSNDPLTDFVHDEDLRWSARCAVGLDTLVEKNGLSALAYFYKGENGNRYEQIASNLIIGNSLLTSKGIPLAGEADLKTAAAMYIMSHLGGGGSFAELHPFDVTDDMVLIGHDGPHHLGIAQDRPVLRKLKKFHGKPGAGISVEFKLKTGPITLLSCSVGKNGFKLIGASGESMPGAIPQTGNTNTRCHFDLRVEDFIAAWCSAGPTHHLALGIGNHLQELEIYSQMAGIPLLQPLKGIGQA